MVMYYSKPIQNKNEFPPKEKLPSELFPWSDHMHDEMSTETFMAQEEGRA
jgi:hypothetical protein